MGIKVNETQYVLDSEPAADTAPVSAPSAPISAPEPVIAPEVTAAAPAATPVAGALIAPSQEPEAAPVAPPVPVVPAPTVNSSPAQPAPAQKPEPQPSVKQPKKVVSEFPAGPGTEPKHKSSVFKIAALIILGLGVIAAVAFSIVMLYVKYYQ
jgi:hypothetical protein